MAISENTCFISFLMTKSFNEDIFVSQFRYIFNIKSNNNKFWHNDE